MIYKLYRGQLVSSFDLKSFGILVQKNRSFSFLQVALVKQLNSARDITHQRRHNVAGFGLTVVHTNRYETHLYLIQHHLLIQPFWHNPRTRRGSKMRRLPVYQIT